MNKHDWLESLKDSATPSLDECILYLGDTFPLLHQFKNTPQDPIWHAEGDVHIHTDMVLHELYQIFATEQYRPSPDNRQILILAALLHDIAKPITTTVDENGRVRARKHEELGLNYLTLRILELELPTNSVIQILNLVGYHQKPKLLVIKNEAKTEYLKLCNIVNYELIYWLEIADMKGRFCEDLEEQLMYLDEFYTLCQEYMSSYDNDLQYLEDDSIYNKQVGHYQIVHGDMSSFSEATTKFYKYTYNNSHFVMTVGISGSGKSTLANTVYPFYHVVSLDNIRKAFYQGSCKRSKEIEGRVMQEAKEMLKTAWNAKVNVVLDATNLRRELREQILTLAHNYHARTTIHVLLKTKVQILKQNKQRFVEIPEEVIEKQITKFQLPTNNESHEVIYDITYDKK